jgi:thioester reductase-like protein
MIENTNNSFALSLSEKRELLKQLLKQKTNFSQPFNPEAEAVLDITIYPEAFSTKQCTKPKFIFLTGATGFLGAYLLSDLLQQTQATIYCLVRSSHVEKAKIKLQKNLESYCLWQENFYSRIIPILGDLSQPFLGLSTETFQRLASKIDTIYHSAAVLNFICPYSTLKPSNVLGTQEVLRLACQVKVKPVHYVSSFAVFESYAHSQKVVREENEPCGEGIYLGYSQSKWVAERLAIIARFRGLPVCIYRSPLISGHSETGIWNTNDFTCRTIKGCIQMKAFPKLDYLLDIVPVDYVSKSIVHLSMQEEALSKTFHLNNPRPIDWSKLVSYINSVGFPVEEISYNAWQERASKDIRSVENSIYLLLPFFVERWSEEQLTIPELYEQARRPYIDCESTLNMLANTSIVCPPVDEKLLDKYFSYFARNKFLSY